MKKSIKDLLFYFTLVSGYIAFAILMGNLYISVIKPAIANFYSSSPMIIIDAGHGGEDSGAVSDSGILEKDINLDIAKRLKEMLNSSGFKTTMVRSDDVSIYQKGSQTIREKKSSDMKNRLEIINSNPNNILVSIHQNKFDEKQYSGAQVWYSKNNGFSHDLAESIKLSFSSLLQPENKRETKAADKSIFLLDKAIVPAVVVECGFISNDAELHLLSDDNYRSKVAFAIYCGILNCKATPKN